MKKITILTILLIVLTLTSCSSHRCNSGNHSGKHWSSNQQR